MADIIHLLPDNIANQIAAGEVIQRPASAVKELLENAVDAGATEVKLIIQDAGKQLIQVIDNGKGMSETDARMSFERHATSKIRNIDDLFHIRTMGFRGEALASIAAVAQVELKTKRADDETGTYLEIENSVVKLQEPVAATNGTSIAMKNLFFNVPARRNFLKSNAAEMRHIIDEFMRVALSFPNIFFSLTNNGTQIFHLEKGSLKQRIVQVMGQHYNARLVTVQEKTDYLNIYGFVGKPDTAKKTRGDQYFFVNNRFIRSAYLNHAVMSAFKEMIPADSFPLYALFIDLDPAQVDINVHPTKQEIKFEDEKIVYAFVQAAVKHALAQFSITPTLEFDLDPTIQQLDALNKPFTEDQQQAARSSDLAKNFSQRGQAHFINPSDKAELKHWKDFFDKDGTPPPMEGGGERPATGYGQKEEKFESLLDKLKKQEGVGDYVPPAQNYTTFAKQLVDDNALLFQLHSSYIVAPTARGFMLIHQQLAHERILYERFAAATVGKSIPAQRSLFPVTLQLSAADAVLLMELAGDLNQLGYLIEPFGTNAFVVQGTPADVSTGNEKLAIENLLEQYKHFSSDLKFSRREKLIRSLAWQQAIKPGTSLSLDEMRGLTTDLFKCAQPNVTASGNPTYIEFKKDYLEQLFKR
ncbi:DNA mismatch repair protein MutL [Niastella yeongjuensis]|uniref:DNA mismatch repair protein MutL n=1 Tax=Niastella yeongjuensis TaxID=354355 RepID=A0A1V9EX58_9BACT|nr:DNA mismatch repair endonuclease MutL [Niastella yeongjuensis]OQP50720.1 DNA mismatch repair protein MutL [Niastella yeongjuensis]SEN21062.1 DNA mismatch repair protein MutL [Niastella yeongjuensis]